ARSTFKGFARLFKGKVRLDNRTDYARVDQARDLDQLISVRLHDEEHTTHTVLSSRFGRSAADDRDENAAGAKDAPGSLQGIPSPCVEHDVSIPALVLEANGGVIDDLVRPELLHEVRVRHARRPDDVSSTPMGELHGVGADTTRGSVDQHHLFRRKAGV